MSENATELDNEPETEFDPSEHNIDDVNAYLEENPNDLQRVLDAEKAGKNRSSLVSALEEKVAGIPQPVSSSVTVEPAAAPGLLDQFEVSPERGYRKKS